MIFSSWVLKVPVSLCNTAFTLSSGEASFALERRQIRDWREWNNRTRSAGDDGKVCPSSPAPPFFFPFPLFFMMQPPRRREPPLCSSRSLSAVMDLSFFLSLCRVQWILARAKRVLDEINFLSRSPMPSASKVPWPLVVDACVNFRLTCLHSDPGLAEQDVYYLEEELNAFVQPLLWRQSAKTSKKEASKR